MTFLATYIHHLNPTLIEIPGTPLAIRWYGFAYVMGFVFAYLILAWLAKRDMYCVAKDKLSDFIAAIAVFGVLIGGRVGSLLFYWLPREGWDGFCADPFWVFRVWEGGMASHGGIIGVALAAIIYSYRHKLSSLAVMDGLAIVAPLGIFFGRLANFINGELYGRICSPENPVAMKFPLELHELYLKDVSAWNDMAVRIQQVAPARPVDMPLTYNSFNNWFVELCRSNDAVLQIVGEYVNFRYPSQLFEAAAEGLIIFLILMAVRLLWKAVPNGFFCMSFCFLYALGRFVTEYYREPDAEMWQGLSRGQYLSFGIVAVGFVFIIPVVRQLISKK